MNWLNESDPDAKDHSVPDVRGHLFIAALSGVVLQVIAFLFGVQWGVVWPFWSGVAVALLVIVAIALRKALKRRKAGEER